MLAVVPIALALFLASRSCAPDPLVREADALQTRVLAAYPDWVLERRVIARNWPSGYDDIHFLLRSSDDFYADVSYNSGRQRDWKPRGDLFTQASIASAFTRAFLARHRGEPASVVEASPIPQPGESVAVHVVPLKSWNPPVSNQVARLEEWRLSSSGGVWEYVRVVP